MLRLCYMMVSKVNEVAPSAYLELAKRLMSTDDLEAFWTGVEIERAPARAQPFRVPGRQRASGPKKVSAKPASSEARESRGAKAAPASRVKIGSRSSTPQSPANSC